MASWAILQLTLLGIGASGFSLWAHHPLPHESLSLPILICGQVLLFSILFSVLTPFTLALAINFTQTLAFDELAGLLSNTSQLQIIQSWGCVGLWMIGLSFWRRYDRATTLAALFTVGGAVLDYLRWEAYLTAGRQEGFIPFSLLPSLCKMSGWLRWLEAGTPAIIALLLLPIIGMVKARSSPPLHSTSIENAAKVKI